MEMKHYTLEQWKTYVGQELTDQEHEQFERHLESCESCLELYMLSLELAADFYPMLRDEQALADQVMEAIQAADQPKSMASRPVIEGASWSWKQNRLKLGPWIRHPLFHYTVAAAITLILMSSGVFQSLADRMGQGDQLSTKPTQAVPWEEPLSVSKKLMDQTIIVLDAIQPKLERGGVR
jgi:hypothetical protein